MTDSDITLSVLIEIRDSIRTMDNSIRTMDTRLSGQIHATNTKLDALTERVDKGFARMDATLGPREAAENPIDLLSEDPFGIRAMNAETWSILRELRW